MLKNKTGGKAASAATAAGRPLHDEIYTRLCQALMGGELEPGEDVTIRALATIFGTSPMPVRDAIGRLVATKALEFGANRAVSVPMMTRARYQEILQVRLSLEAMATRRAVPHLTGQKITYLEGINEEMAAAARADDAKKYFACNRQFHLSIYEAGNSVVILPFIEILWMHSGPFLNLMFNETGIETGQDNHQEIMRAIRRGDADAAALSIAKDIGDAADTILARAVFSDG